MACLGIVGYGVARQAWTAGRGELWQGSARQAKRGLAGCVEIWLGMAGKAMCGAVRRGSLRPGTAMQAWLGRGGLVMQGMVWQVWRGGVWYV